jgi:hypothetical protein
VYFESAMHNVNPKGFFKTEKFYSCGQFVFIKHGTIFSLSKTKNKMQGYFLHSVKHVSKGITKMGQRLIVASYMPLF